MNRIKRKVKIRTFTQNEKSKQILTKTEYQNMTIFQ